MKTAASKLQIGISWKLKDYEAIENLGFDFFDVFGADMMSLSDEEFAPLAEKVRNGVLPCNNICLYCGPEIKMMGDCYDPETVFCYAEKACKRCKALGIKGIGIGSGASRTVPDGFSAEKAAAQLLDAIRITAGEAAKYGIDILIEPLNTMVCNYMTSTAAAAEFIDIVAMDNVHMVFDFHHAEIMDEKPVDYAPYISYMRSVQFNEIDFVSGSKLFLREENKETYKNWLKTMLELGYAGPFSLEAIVTEDFLEDIKRSKTILEDILSQL